MAEARSEEDEENMMRDSREQVVRRQPNRGRTDRRKPENRHSQGPLSSIRAAIKRTSTRSTSLSETSSRDRDRERDRERDRDRRRPEITILSAEPLASTSWFPGASAGFPPPPPPAAQIWGPTIPPAIQPPPSYEEVIREKTREQVLLPSSSTSRSSPSLSDPVSTTTIATQTNPGSAPDLHDSKVQQPLRPRRPPLPHPPKYSPTDVATTTTTSQSTVTPLTSDSVVPSTLPETITNASAHTQCCDLSDFSSPLTSTTVSQTDQQPAVEVTAPPATYSHDELQRPRPRPRSKVGVKRISNEVKVQTLVKLREDGLATLAARAGSESANQGVSQGKYLQELLEAFSSDDWGFPEGHSDSSENSQSGSEEEDEDDMATLKARIQAFEQQQQQDGSCGETISTDSVGTKRPEPKPRPRLQGQPAKCAPPTIAPKPKNISSTPKPSSKVFWEVGDMEPTKTQSADINTEPQTTPEALASSTPGSTPAPQSCKTTEKPLITPKPQSASEALLSNFPSPASAPVPAPRPPPPSLSNPKPPPRPAAAPRASMGSPHRDKSISSEHATPPLPPRPAKEISSSKTESQAGSDEMHNSANPPVKVGSVRPSIVNKPAALISPRRASAPTLAPKPSGASPTPPDLNPVPAKSAAATPGPVTRPLGLTPAPIPGLKPPAPAPAPALRKGSVIQSKSEAASTANCADPPLPPRPSSAKYLPLRPPPMKSTPERPPPPVVTTATNHIPGPSKTSPASSRSSVRQASLTGSSPPSATASQSQRVPKRGPPLPPRPKPGHPLYDSYVKQEVLIVLDDPSPAPPEHLAVEGKSQTPVAPIISQSQCLLDLDTQLDPVLRQDSQSKSALENLSLLDSESILPAHPAEQKEQPDLPPVSGPRCRALFDFEGENNDELTFSQGDVIGLLELIGEEWGRGQIHGQVGIFPLNFTKVVESLPQPGDTPSTNTAVIEDTAAPKTCESPSSKAEEVKEEQEWVVAVFDFPGQTAEDLSFHKGALIHVTEHIDAEWRRGSLDGREGLYPAAFTQPCHVQPVGKGVAKALFDFTAEREDELTLKADDIISQVESVDEQWIMGVVGGKRGIVPKNYISLL